MGFPKFKQEKNEQRDQERDRERATERERKRPKDRERETERKEKDVYPAGSGRLRGCPQGYKRYPNITNSIKQTKSA